MKKIIVIVLIVVVAVVAAAGFGLWYMMGQPLYRPGMVRARATLDPPPAVEGESGWPMDGDATLHQFAAGAGAPVLVVHGGPGTPPDAPFRGLEPLTVDHRFVYYHQRGCGRSTRPFDRFASTSFYANMVALERTLGLGAQIADVERIRRTLGVERLTVVGHSFGAFIAALYAAEFPERVERLVLVAPADMLVMPPPDGGIFGVVERRLPETRRDEYADFVDAYLSFGDVFEKSEAELADEHRRFAAYYLAASGAGPDEIEAALAPMRGEHGNGGWMVTAMYFSMGKRHDYRAALAAVDAPVLVLHGADDLQPERVSRSYMEALPNAELKVVPDADHFMLDAEPGPATTAISDFLRRQ
jgi:proline iminopeptidase